MLTYLLNRTVLAHALSHFTLEAYSNLLPMLFPLLVPILGLSYAQVGLAMTVLTLSRSLLQPALGHLADRFGSRWLGPGSVALMVVAMSLIGLSWNYAVLLFMVALAGLASGAFHPQGVRGVSLASGSRGSSVLSVFLLGGTTGFALGPLIAAAIFTSMGRGGGLVLLPVGLVLSWLLFLLLRSGEKSVPREMVRRSHEGEEVRTSYRVLAAVIGVSILVAWLDMGLITYLPLLLTGAGETSGTASQVLFVLLIFGSLGVILGGVLTERVGPRATVLLFFLPLVPAVFFFLYTGGTSLALAALVGVMHTPTTPITLMLAQKFAPRNMGMVAGTVMGVGSIAGGAGVWLMGILADTWGLQVVMNMLVVLPLLVAIFALTFPSRQQEKVPASRAALSP